LGFDLELQQDEKRRTFTVFNGGVGMARPIAVARHPIVSMLLPVPIVCFVGALLTDLSYVNSGGNLLWLNFSSWLIAAGLTFGGITLVLMIIDALRARGRHEGNVWLPFIVLGLAWVVEFLNALIHARDGWTAVVPTGMILSIVGALLALAAGWLSRSAIDPVIADAR
jgi:uncharacterized membrane protein